jgi:hypothetical protein
MGEAGRGSFPRPAERCYREFQLNGAGIIVDDDEDDGTFGWMESRLLPKPPQKTLDQQSKHDSDDDEERAEGRHGITSSSTTRRESAGARFAAFLRNDAAEARVMWLTHGAFVACTRNEHYDDLPSDEPPPEDSWKACWMDFPWEYELDVTLSDGRDYIVQLQGTVNASRPNRRNGAMLWAPVLTKLLVRDPNVRSLRCSSDAPLSSLESLEEIVSAAPPPGCDRVLEFTAVSSRTAARVIATCLHPETELVVDPVLWGSRLPVLVDAMRAPAPHRGPARLAVRGLTPSVRQYQRLADGIRTATPALEHLSLELEDFQLPSLSCSLRLLRGVRDNVGLRSVRAAAFGIRSPLLKDFWTSVLASRTLERIDASAIVLLGCAPHQRRAHARHVVEHLASNRAVTHIQYDARTHDADIMENQAVPMLLLNRLRGVLVDDALEADTEAALAGAGADRSPREHVLSALLLGSDAVQRHPVLRFHLLRRSAETLAKLLSAPASSQAGAGVVRRRRRRDDDAPSGDGPSGGSRVRARPEAASSSTGC